MSVYQRQPTMDDRAYLTEAQHLDSYLSPTIIIDDMAVVHEFTKSHSNCQDHSAFFICAIDNKSFGYCEAYLLFDDYITNSLKVHTRQLRTASRSSDPGSKVNDNTPTQI